MGILVQNEIQAAIHRCQPLRIAVAYIGADWNNFVADVDRLETVIVSPTLGSNPRAITQLAKRIGWDNVLFLNELHAKMYLGQNSVIVGSANLSRNGLSGEDLFELCVEFENNDENVNEVNRVNEVFMELMQRANNQYPSTESKQERLHELQMIRDNAQAHRIYQAEAERPSFNDFELLANDHFYVCWYRPAELEYAQEVQAIANFIQDEVTFAEIDDLQRNKWVLMWQITNNKAPDLRSRPYWLYIHEIFENGVTHENGEETLYTKLAIQRNDLEIPDYPFELTDDVIQAFRQAIQNDEVVQYLIQPDTEFRLADSLQGLPLLIQQMRVHLGIH